MRTLIFLFLSSGCLFGCGGEKESFKLAPVSGTVTLDDKPLTNATVTFLPQGDTANPGPAAVGITDDQGRFTLKTSQGEEGAVVGKNQVMIVTLDEGNSDESDEVDYTRVEKLPARYNSETELVSEVPEGGTDKSDFDLKSN